MRVAVVMMAMSSPCETLHHVLPASWAVIFVSLGVGSGAVSKAKSATGPYDWVQYETE